MATNHETLLLVGTRKGAFLLESDAARRAWTVGEPHFLGSIVHHLVLDPRDRKTLLCAAKTGHLGPTVFRSQDRGRTWAEAETPPAFAKREGGRAVDHVFWLTPGHATEPGTWYAGSSPQGLFRSEDHGVTWAPVAGFNDHPKYRDWTGGEQDGTPDGPKLHSVIVDRLDPNRLYVGCSSGGVFTSPDRGASWAPLNQGLAADFLPDPNAEYGHDPHCMVQHPAAPDCFYQQNHCGIYRLDRPAMRWERIGRNMPADVGDIGFPIVVHPRRPDVAWVFPMDGTQVWPRTSPGGRAAVFMTEDGGASWRRCAKGMPAVPCWWTVKRQSMAADDHDPVGVYFGTTSGEIWMSGDEGASWREIARHLPHVYSVEAARA